jgi:hypothetical protein
MHEEEEKEEEEDEEEADWKASIQCGRAFIEYAIANDTLGKLGRHETTLMNSFSKTLHELRLLQHDRADIKGNTAKVIPLPTTARRRNRLTLAGDLVEAKAEK